MRLVKIWNGIFVAGTIGDHYSAYVLPMTPAIFSRGTAAPNDAENRLRKRHAAAHREIVRINLVARSHGVTFTTCDQRETEGGTVVHTPINRRNIDLLDR